MAPRNGSSPFTLDVSSDSRDADLARKMVTIAERGCQVVNTLLGTTSFSLRTKEGTMREFFF